MVPQFMWPVCVHEVVILLEESVGTQGVKKISCLEICMCYNQLYVMFEHWD